MLFRLRNVAQTFQRLMKGFLQGLPFAFDYIEDILVAIMNHAEHVFYIRQVLEHLEANYLIIRLDKRHFGLGTISFLEQKVSADGICSCPTKVQAVKEFPLSPTSHSLSHFLGLPIQAFYDEMSLSLWMDPGSYVISP